MTKLMTASGAAIALCLLAVPASAQATRTWVSSTGLDSNPCSRTAPCQTFAGAISKTAINGEINCIDPSGYGSVNIGRSITIDCHDVFASVLASGATGIVINAPPFFANDPLRTVRLRNISINGAGLSGSTGTRVSPIGIRIISASAVYLDDMMISEFTQRGISDERTSAGMLYIKNSTIRDNGQSGLVVLPAGGVSAPIGVVVDGSQFIGNVSAGIAVSNGAQVSLKRSVISGNGFGIDVEGSVAASTLLIDDSQITNNGTGFFQSGSGSIRASNTEFSFNSVNGSGTLNSFTNNRFSGNGAGGTVSPVGVTSNPSGQQ